MDGVDSREPCFGPHNPPSGRPRRAPDVSNALKRARERMCPVFWCLARREPCSAASGSATVNRLTAARTSSTARCPDRRGPCLAHRLCARFITPYPCRGGQAQCEPKYGLDRREPRLDRREPRLDRRGPLGTACPGGAEMTSPESTRGSEALVEPLDRSGRREPLAVGRIGAHRRSRGAGAEREALVETSPVGVVVFDVCPSRQYRGTWGPIPRGRSVRLPRPPRCSFEDFMAPRNGVVAVHQAPGAGVDSHLSGSGTGSDRSPRVARPQPPRRQRMNKSKLSSRVAADASLSKAGAASVIDTVLSTITVGAQDLEPAQM